MAGTTAKSSDDTLGSKQSQQRAHTERLAEPNAGRAQKPPQGAAPSTAARVRCRSARQWGLIWREEMEDEDGLLELGGSWGEAAEFREELEEAPLQDSVPKSPRVLSRAEKSASQLYQDARPETPFRRKAVMQPHGGFCKKCSRNHLDATEPCDITTKLRKGDEEHMFRRHANVDPTGMEQASQPRRPWTCARRVKQHVPTRRHSLFALSGSTSYGYATNQMPLKKERHPLTSSKSHIIKHNDGAGRADRKAEAQASKALSARAATAEVSKTE